MRRTMYKKDMQFAIINYAQLSSPDVQVEIEILRP